MASTDSCGSSEDPVIVFDEESESSSPVESPIFLKFRQPSFTCLYGNPIPKGYHSLSDFRTRFLVANLENPGAVMRARQRYDTMPSTRPIDRREG
jgi:hypothetical protein